MPGLNIKLANPPNAHFDAQLQEFAAPNNKTGEWLRINVPSALNKRKVWFHVSHTGAVVNETWWYIGELAAFKNKTKKWGRPWGNTVKNGAVTPHYADNGAGTASTQILVSYADEVNFSPTAADSAFQKDCAMILKSGVFRRYVLPFEIFVDCDTFVFSALDHRIPAGLTTVAYLAVESQYGLV